MEDCNFTDKTLSETLRDRLLMWASKYNIDLGDAQRSLALILSDYEIHPKETALAVFTEGKNEIYLKKFILGKAIAGCSKRTLEQYKACIARFLDAIGKDADTITSEDIQLYFADLLMKGDSKCHVDNIRRYLSSFYAYLMREEFVTKNPILKVDKIKFHSEKETAFDNYEIEKMRNTCQNEREKAILEILLSTGCRATEACSIKISDIDDEQITVFGKGGKYRTVYLNAKCIVALQAYLAERKDCNPYLFPRAKQAKDDPVLMGKYRHFKGDWYKYPEFVDKSEPMNKETINICVKRIAKRAGVEGAHTHRFRRTCATMALRRGMPIELVSKMLGHEDLKTTQIYLDLREEDLKNAHEKFVY